MTSPTTHWTDRFIKSLPDREMLAAHPWMQPVARRLLDPQLWRLQHEAVARGVAVGTFWAFVVPVAQILVSAVHCTFWRANIPAAAAMTLITNPFTIGLWLWLAYQLGAFLLGVPSAAEAGQDINLTSWFTEYGWPTVLGMGVFAIGGAVLGYFSVKLIWRLRIWLKRRARR